MTNIQPQASVEVPASVPCDLWINPYQPAEEGNMLVTTVTTD